MVYMGLPGTQNWGNRKSKDHILRHNVAKDTEHDHIAIIVRDVGNGDGTVTIQKAWYAFTA